MAIENDRPEHLAHFTNDRLYLVPTLCSLFLYSALLLSQVGFKSTLNAEFTADDTSIGRPRKAWEVRPATSLKRMTISKRVYRAIGAGERLATVSDVFNR
jgi:hypothetical protein